MTRGHGEKRSRRQGLLIDALILERTVEDAARAAGVSKKTALTWLADPSFKAAFDRAAREVFSPAKAKLRAASGRAVDTLVNELDGDTAAGRIAAARAILDHNAKYAEIADLAAELEALKEQIEGGSDVAGGTAERGPEGAGGA